MPTRISGFGSSHHIPVDQFKCQECLFPAEKSHAIRLPSDYLHWRGDPWWNSFSVNVSQKRELVCFHLQVPYPLHCFEVDALRPCNKSLASFHCRQHFCTCATLRATQIFTEEGVRVELLSSLDSRDWPSWVSSSTWNRPICHHVHPSGSSHTLHCCPSYGYDKNVAMFLLLKSNISTRNSLPRAPSQRSATMLGLALSQAPLNSESAVAMFLSHSLEL